MSTVVYIVTPCRNAVDSIDRTILSVITQAGDFRIRYHVQDRGSQDGTQARLAWWRAELEAPQSPVLCRDVWFSCDSAPDAGAHDAIRRGFSRLPAPPEAFLTWLAAGDVLLPGALAHVVAIAAQFTGAEVPWISGTVPLIRDHRLVATYDVPRPTEALRRGVFGDLPGGAVFRKALWAASGAEDRLPGSGPGTAADLWQRFARSSALVQTPYPLCALRSRPDPVAGVTPPDRAALLELAGAGPVWRRRMRIGEDASALRIVEEDVSEILRTLAGGVPGTGGAAMPAAAERRMQEGRSVSVPPPAIPPGPGGAGSPFTRLPACRDLLGPASRDAEATRQRFAPLARAWPHLVQADPVWADPVWHGPGIVAFDQGWQAEPATEWRAFRQMRAVGAIPDGVSYVAYPWADLIDRLRADPVRPLARFRAFCAALPAGNSRITVCQHPDLPAHVRLFAEAGIADVFWPFVTPQARQIAAVQGVRLHCVAQSPEALWQTPGSAERPALLAWLAGDGGEMSRDFGRDPARSHFALCPAGAGGNSPALWQALAAGAVPVILSGDPEATRTAGLPGNPALWRAATLCCPPARPALQALPDQLRGLVHAPGQLAALHHGLLQIRLLYGPKAFVHDIQILIAERAQSRAGAAPAADAHRPTPPARTAPRPARAALPKIFLLGPRSARTPLGYAPFQRMAAARMTITPTPDDADLILTGWNLDLQENATALAPVLARRPQTRLLVLSEEPLWDTVWSGGFAARDRVFDCAGTPRPYRFLNHMNSRIFAFERIPYFPLTSDAFCARHVPLLAGFADMGAQDLLRHWQQAPLRAAFLAEVRDDPVFDVSHPAHRVQGLSAYRTAVARLLPGPDVLRAGRGWPAAGQSPAAPPRQDLPDWHLDKLACLHGRVRVCSAYENTHQPDYISEKVFDAFAVGAIPVCHADPGHRLHDLVAPGAMLNTFGQSPEVAAARIAALTPDRAMADAWLSTAAALRALLADPEAVMAERRRILDEIFAEIAALG